MRSPSRVVAVAALLGLCNLTLMLWLLHAKGVPDAQSAASQGGIHDPVADEVGVAFVPIEPVPLKHDIVLQQPGGAHAHHHHQQHHGPSSATNDGGGDLDPSSNVTLHKHLHRRADIDVDGHDPAARLHHGHQHHHHHHQPGGKEAKPGAAVRAAPPRRQAKHRHAADDEADTGDGEREEDDARQEDDAPAAVPDEDGGEDAAESSASSTGGSGGGHHGKKSFYNLNKADDMLPAVCPPTTIRLDAARNRTYALFHVVGDWGGPGRQPQREVAGSMGAVAEGGLKRLLPAGTRLGQGTVTTGDRAADDPAGRDRVARRQLFGSFVQVDGEGVLADPLHPESSSFTPVGSSVDFVVSTGDNMYEDGVKDEYDVKLQRNFEKVYTHPALKEPRWYMSLGNHDHGAHGVMRDVRGQVRYTNRSTRWFLPSTYYSQRIDVVDVTASAKTGKKGGGLGFTIDLIVLDVYDVSPFMTKISDGQLKWFEETISASDADWKIVVGHRPIFSAGSKHGSSPYMQKHILTLLAKHRAAMYLCGDDHELQLMESHGVLLGLSGGGARAKSDLKKKGLPETVFQAGVHGFMSVALTKDEVAVSIIDKAGTVLKRIVRARAKPDSTSA